MTKLKDEIVQIVGQNATQRAGELAGQFVRAASEEKEAILAGIDFERWLAGTCQLCLAKSKNC